MKEKIIIRHKYINITIGILGLILLVINVYFSGHFLTNVAMILVAIGMGIKAYTLNQQEKKEGRQINFKISDSQWNISFFLLVFSLTGIIIFFIWQWWLLFSISLLMAVSAGIIWYRKIKVKNL